MADAMSRTEAEQHLHELAARARDIVGTHIRGITFGHDDLRKLADAVDVILGAAEPDSPAG